MSFVKEVWYGQRSLAETYWFWGFLVGGIGVGVVGQLITGAFMAAMRSTFPLYLYIALVLPTGVWQTVANWRSATNHPSGWATLVKVLVVISIPILLVQYAALFTMSFRDL